VPISGYTGIKIGKQEIEMAALSFIAQSLFVAGLLFVYGIGFLFILGLMLRSLRS
jgi:hypothetical protein